MKLFSKCNHHWIIKLIAEDLYKSPKVAVLTCKKCNKIKIWKSKGKYGCLTGSQELRFYMELLNSKSKYKKPLISYRNAKEKIINLSDYKRK